MSLAQESSYFAKQDGNSDDLFWVKEPRRPEKKHYLYRTWRRRQ